MPSLVYRHRQSLYRPLHLGSKSTNARTSLASLALGVLVASQVPTWRNGALCRFSYSRTRSLVTATNHSDVIYSGPLTRTFRSLKIFSLSSLGLATALTPFMFIMETSLPFAARVALASTAMLTSGVSTALVGWCGHPYVSSIRTVRQGSPVDEAGEHAVQAIQMETVSLLLRPRYTTVYDSSFLAETRRPFAKWELAESVTLPDTESGGPEALEETIAETADSSGKVLGRWIVSWDDKGSVGKCRAEGQIQRYFNVHEELLTTTIR